MGLYNGKYPLWSRRTKQSKIYSLIFALVILSMVLAAKWAIEYFKS